MLRLNVVTLSAIISLFFSKGWGLTYPIDCKIQQSSEINCTISAIIPPSQHSCFDGNIVQIRGEIPELYINCSSKFPLDLDYNGFQPNEAIVPVFSKQISEDSSRDLVSYNLLVTVYSNAKMQNMYQSQHQPRRPAYPRTGNYTIRGVFNATLSWSVYLFLEENEEVFLIHNANTVAITQLEDGLFLIPCRPSHKNSTISLFPKSVQVRGYIPTEGFTVFIPNSVSSNASSAADLGDIFGCRVANGGGRQSSERTTNGLTLTLITFLTGDSKNNFGFGKLSSSASGGNAINMDSLVQSSETGEFTVNLACSIPTSESGYPSETVSLAVLTAIEAINPSHSRLVQEFVLPEYRSYSYSLKIATPSSPPGLFSIPNAKLSGLVFCSSGEEYKVQEYATGFDKLVRRFPLGTNWSAFDISKSPPRNHLQIELEEARKGVSRNNLYVNHSYKLKCMVRTHGLVAPVVWYKKFNDGSLEQENIGYTLTETFSHVIIRITENLSEILCAASFWDRNLWKNVSMTVTPKNGKPPTFLNAQAINRVKIAGGTKYQTLQCSAIGDPIPELRWFNSSGFQLGQTATGKISLELTPQYVGTNLTCFASNLFGNSSINFIIETLTATPTGTSLYFWVGVSFAVLIIVSLVVGWLYFVNNKKQDNSRLTQKEIHDFRNGIAQTESVTEDLSPADNDYVPLSALVAPYDRNYEISSNKFQISKTEILGSGAYGVVYRGILNEKPVAAKSVKPDADKMYIKALLSELKIMIYLGKHKQLVEFIGANTRQLQKGQLYVFVEMCELGNLEKYLRNNRDNFESAYRYGNHPKWTSSHKICLPDLFKWAYQISAGMEYLESKRVIHGDLAARNVLLTNNKTAKITDFGLSRQLYNYASYIKKNEEPLPWRWMSIESLRDLQFSSKSDVWSFGLVIFELFSLGEIPYPGLVWNADFVKKLLAGLRMGRPTYATPEMYRQIMLPTWDINPNERPDFATLALTLKELTFQGLDKDPEVESMDKESNNANNYQYEYYNDNSGDSEIE